LNRPIKEILKDNSKQLNTKSNISFKKKSEKFQNVNPRKNEK